MRLFPGYLSEITKTHRQSLRFKFRLPLLNDNLILYGFANRPPADSLKLSMPFMKQSYIKSSIDRAMLAAIEVTPASCLPLTRVSRVECTRVVSLPKLSKRIASLVVVAVMLAIGPACLWAQDESVLSNDVATEDAPAPAAKAAAPLTPAQQATFESAVAPMLQAYCGDCHAEGANEGGIVLDEIFDSQSTGRSIALWERVIKQLRHDLMPPREEDQPADAEVAAVEAWIKSAVFKIDPAKPDPGHVIVRRLNREEYRNTIKDLMDYEINTNLLFPPDDTGHGFDNIADVLTLSPLLMEKYINAATEIVEARVPVKSGVPQHRGFVLSDFEILEKVKTRPAALAHSDSKKTIRQEARVEGEKVDESRAAAVDEKTEKDTKAANLVEPMEVDNGELLFFYSGGGKVKLNFNVILTGEYKLLLVLKAGEDYVEGAIDENRCRVEVICDGEVIGDQELSREGWTAFNFIVEKTFQQGEHDLTIDVTPLTNAQQTRRLRLIVEKTMLTGPLDDPDTFVRPDRHEKYFPNPIPADDAARRTYASALLRAFAKKAFRRPPESETVTQLVDLAQSVWSAQGVADATFEKGVAHAMIAVLSSPNFIFRETFAEPAGDGSALNVGLAEGTALVDEYTLASRLSYFLWSTMPDERMIKLAEEGKLRFELENVVKQMVKDERFESFYENFVGQWLRVRDIDGVTIDAVAILRSGEDGKIEEELRKNIRRLKSLGDLTDAQQNELKESYQEFRKLREKVEEFALTTRLRASMRQETELLFKHIVNNNSDLVQLIDCDFTFLNERLAKHYGIEGVVGNKMRKVRLNPADHRGGILTHGSLLAVTSNPNRTSPVKRGMFILDNLLGMPTGAPPPDIPSLEESAGEADQHRTLRQALELHRADPMCSSCHDRMDPLGLALENFDALGRYRTQDSGERVDASGQLISGESFKNVDELKKILAKSHRDKFYRVLTEKLLTYALGRTVEYYDLQTVDDIVGRLESSGGKPSLLLRGIIQSPAFQRTRVK